MEKQFISEHPRSSILFYYLLLTNLATKNTPAATNCKFITIPFSDGLVIDHEIYIFVSRKAYIKELKDFQTKTERTSNRFYRLSFTPLSLIKCLPQINTRIRKCAFTTSAFQTKVCCFWQV